MCHLHGVISLHNARTILYTVLSHYTMPAPYCTQCYRTTQCQHHIVHSVVSLHSTSTILYTVLSHYTIPAPYCTQCYRTTQWQHHIVHSVISLHNASTILYTVLSHYTMPAPYCTPSASSWAASLLVSSRLRPCASSPPSHLPSSLLARFAFGSP